MPTADKELLDDSALIARCLEGRVDAWETLVRRYRRLIYSVPARMRLSPDDAADVFQSVCAQLIGHMDRLRDHKKLAGWLVTTATRECYRISRLNRREIPMRLEEESSPAACIADPADPADVFVLRHERMRELRVAIEKLPPKSRELLEMLFFTEDPPTYEELSRRLSIPVASIGPTRARCLEKLRGLVAGGARSEARAEGSSPQPVG